MIRGQGGLSRLRRSRYRSQRDLELAEANRTLIAAASAELVERDGRTYRLIRLPDVERSPLQERRRPRLLPSDSLD